MWLGYVIRWKGFPMAYIKGRPSCSVKIRNSLTSKYDSIRVDYGHLFHWSHYQYADDIKRIKTRTGMPKTFLCLLKKLFSKIYRSWIFSSTPKHNKICLVFRGHDNFLQTLCESCTLLRWFSTHKRVVHGINMIMYLISKATWT